MSISYQQQLVLSRLDARAQIADLTARQNRAYSTGDKRAWLSTFTFHDATFTRDGKTHTDLREAFDGGEMRVVTLDHEVAVDGIEATQHCVAVFFQRGVVDGHVSVASTGSFTDTLVYERGNWYFASRTLSFDPRPVRGHARA